jgi:hypothetical protein
VVLLNGPDHAKSRRFLQWLSTPIADARLLSRPSSRTRRRRLPASFGATCAETLTDTDMLLSLPPQIRRAILDRREGRF